MSTELVRLFTCASVISLGGLTAMASVVACSSSSDTTPAPGDDDDDDTPKKDAGSSSSGSGSSSSGGVDAGAKRPDWCTSTKIAGTYAFGKATYKVTTAGKVCDNYAKAGNDNGGALGDVTYTPSGEGQLTMTLASDAAYKLVLLLADDRCQLAGAEQPYGQKTVDADGKPIDVKLASNHIIDLDENGGVKDTVSIFVDSDPSGAPGTPCVIQSTTTGTKK
jgi:hypothetical protein